MNANVKIAFLIVVVQFLLQSQKLDYPNLLFLAVMTVGVFLIKSKEHTFIL